MGRDEGKGAAVVACALGVCMDVEGTRQRVVGVDGAGEAWRGRAVGRGPGRDWIFVNTGR